MTEHSTDRPSPWEDLDAYVALPRLGGLQLAPQGDFLVAGVQSLDEKGTSWITSLWQVPTVSGGEHGPRRLTRSTAGENQWVVLRDGSVLFTSSRAVPGEAESVKGLWSLSAQGGEAQCLMSREGGFGKIIAARDEDRVVAGVSLGVGRQSLEEDANWRKDRRENKVSAIMHEGAGVRFWDHDLPRTVVRFAAGDLTHGQDGLQLSGLEIGSPDLGVGLEPEGVLSARGDFLVATVDAPERHGSRRARLVRIDLDAHTSTDVIGDGEFHYFTPVLSRDDRWLACVRYQEPTPTTAPNQSLVLVDLETGTSRGLATDWDRWPSPVAFSPDGALLYVVAEDHGQQPVFAIEVATGEVRRLTAEGTHANVVLAPDGTALYAVRSGWEEAGCVVRIDATTGTSEVLHRVVELPPFPGRVETIESRAADGSTISSRLLIPHGASQEDPAPLVLWVHGGPLNSWNGWSWRWCPWLLVSQGRAVLMPDPALSTGYGQAMVERGWGRWGSEPFTDVMTATDDAVARPDIDEDRTAMMGGSFGGYMANWIAGHTTRFRAIVSHASLWNLETFGGTTDVPWYWEVELTPAMRAENSPHRFADRIQTPMLVIHGDRDHRVPIGEGLSLWWELCRLHQGTPESLPHKFLYFPDENHWVLSPQHAKLWNQTVRAFLATHLDGVDFQLPDHL